ncbi:regulator of chromosome condensation (RCC1) repeat family protein [Carpediemonas membranifera]|uniref:Regulator of chromosome condensation (RCC1) repeat family protein n=1 Tax=Carpediemonas membranifera TaxID=201153 RepID=A0A8J6B875_9EUKA|nr:regulator of chromosome condensation (RCC1) repeat family protein [Carpediemonas membranifera]|eukprot:KAG9395174.1 regulator of chromosome condensation (RCC1) repeat family protein [Carpediemonas membranifera]
MIDSPQASIAMLEAVLGTLQSTELTNATTAAKERMLSACRNLIATITDLYALESINSVQTTSDDQLTLIASKLQALGAVVDQVTMHHPGDIPTLIKRAHKAVVARIGGTSTAVPTFITPTTIEQRLGHIQSTLESIPADPPVRINELSTARRLLRTGGDRSMNIELADGGLPDTLYTLMQGTVWATLMQAGADPSLGEGAAGEFSKDARVLWFLCKKFAFCRSVASRDGERHTELNRFAKLDSILYHGRLFVCGTNRSNPADPGEVETIPTFHRIRVPPVLSFSGNSRDALFVVAVTARGLYTMGDNRFGALGLGGSFGFLKVPRRARFPMAPKVSRFEEGLATWRKDRLVVDILVCQAQTFIETPVGVIAAGDNAHGRLGVGQQTEIVPHFTPVPMPRGPSVRDLRFSDSMVSVLVGQDLYVAGENCEARFGLGHDDDVPRLAKLPFPVTDAAFDGTTGLFLHDGVIRACGLRADFWYFRDSEYAELDQIPFPWPVSRFVCGDDAYWVQRHDTGDWYGLGSNDYGALGVPVPGDCDFWVKLDVKGITEIRASPGGLSTWFTTDSGAVLACGENYHGHLGVDSEGRGRDEVVRVPRPMVRRTYAFDGAGKLSMWALDPAKTAIAQFH